MYNSIFLVCGGQMVFLILIVIFYSIIFIDFCRSWEYVLFLFFFGNFFSFFFGFNVVFSELFVCFDQLDYVYDLFEGYDGEVYISDNLGLEVVYFVCFCYFECIGVVRVGEDYVENVGVDLGVLVNGGGG